MGYHCCKKKECSSSARPRAALPHFCLLCKIGSIRCFPSRPLIDDHRALNFFTFAADQLSSAHRAYFCIAAPMVIVTGSCVAVVAPFTGISEERDARVFLIFNVDYGHTAAVRFSGI